MPGQNPLAHGCNAHPRDAQGARTLNHLFETGEIDLRRGSIFDLSPTPMPADLDFGRVEGMLLGLAIGDALGNTSEGMLSGQRRALHGEIRDYLPNRHAKGQPIGLPSDDTQLACWTLEQMLEDGGFDPDHVAARFCSGRIFGIGSTVKEFIRHYKSGRLTGEGSPLLMPVTCGTQGLSCWRRSRASSSS